MDRFSDYFMTLFQLHSVELIILCVELDIAPYGGGGGYSEEEYRTGGWVSYLLKGSVIWNLYQTLVCLSNEGSCDGLGM
jgi:hypothetical protein